MGRRSFIVVIYGWVVLNLIVLLAWWQWRSTEEISWGFWLTCVLATLGLVPVLWLQQAESPAPPEQASPTDPDSPPEPPHPVVDPVNPYRGRLQTAVDAAKLFAAPVAASTSATVLSLVVGGTMFTASLLVSSLLRLPGWIEAELVLLLLWVLGITVFSGMLWRGSRLADDRRLLGLTWNTPFENGFPSPSARIFTDGCGCVMSDGAVLLVLIAATFAVSLLLVEFLLPAVFLVIYYSLFAGVGRVVNDRHECRGRPLRALLWGTFWTTLYLAPVAIVVALLGHAVSLATR